jgi:beta-lactamase regulating signal transducer with metallopeptidase domain
LELIGYEAFDRNSINKVYYNGAESEWNEKQFALAMGLSPYAKVKFADGNVNGESVSNTSDESVEASKEVSQEVSNNAKNDEDTNGIMIVSIVVIITVVVCSIVVVVLRRKAK